MKWIAPMAVIDDVVSVMTERIVSGFQPERIIVFGSYARGEAREESDIDLLVVMPDGTDRRQTAIAILGALGGLGVAKDVVVTTPDEIARRGDLVGTVLRPALREGKVLYERAGRLRFVGAVLEPPSGDRHSVL
jgi:predicted nucleotidyltransferase